MTTKADQPDYYRVWLTFLRNSFLREFSFRSNFIINIITRAFWFVSQLLFYEIIYTNVPMVAGWTRAEYFGFMATTMLVNSMVETFFMPNCAQLSEHIRKGTLDFALVKPIDTQFLISFERINLPMLFQSGIALVLLGYSLQGIEHLPSLVNVISYIGLIGVATVFFYSLMIALASTSVWFGRNTGLYDFWFYVTIFARYPSDIYSGSPIAEMLRFVFSYILPILVVMTIPARLIVSKTLEPNWMTGCVVLTTAVAFFVSRRIFQWSLSNYRSASS
jgi:ABC-2 type transport system permease protein